MDAFEEVVSEILWMEGHWVRTSVKVVLTRDEKISIDRPSSPRWELDIVAYSGRDNLLRIVECKSYIDSRGVQLKSLDGSDAKSATLFKLFNDKKLRGVVFDALSRQFVESRACAPDPKIRLCLACGRIASDADRKGLCRIFEENGWELWDEDWLYKELRKMSEGGYENKVSAVVSKLLLRAKGN